MSNLQFIAPAMVKTEGKKVEWAKENHVRKKRKYVRRKLTDTLIIKRVTSIRTRNNKQWMALLNLAFKIKPRLSRKIMVNIVENDRQIARLMAKLGTRKK